MNILEQIEKQFDFEYPELYKILYSDGMLDWGEYGPNWAAIYLAKFKITPPLLFFGDDIELFELNKISEEISNLRNPNDYRKVKPGFQFIPFARTGRHDLYVFQFDKQFGENVPITLLPHDYEFATILAKNLQDFIFLIMLECVVNIDKDSSDFVNNDNLKTNLFNMLKTHKAYLNHGQYVKIEEIYNRDFFDYKYKYRNGREEIWTGLITEDEFEKTLQQEIGFKDLDKEFKYMG
jgi:hypothetical protein